MCGIVGVLALNGPVDAGVVRNMASSLRHRGPDAEGFYTAGSVPLGFRRLAILDLTPAGDQPMRSSDGTLALVFNGALSNYVESLRERQGLGHRFTWTAQ